LSAKNAIKKLQQIVREKEAQRSEHIQRQEEEVELLRIIEVEEELRRAKRGVLNIQPLAIRLSPHSSSSLECVKGRHIMRRYILHRQ
jgi:hypothetical protein